VRPEPHEFEAAIITGLAVNQHQIRAQVAVPEFLPLTGERMIEITLRQGLISGQQIHRLQ